VNARAKSHMKVRVDLAKVVLADEMRGEDEEETQLLRRM
jgi:hypothetical protein